MMTIIRNNSHPKIERSNLGGSISSRIHKPTRQANSESEIDSESNKLSHKLISRLRLKSKIIPSAPIPSQRLWMIIPKVKS